MRRKILFFITVLCMSAFVGCGSNEKQPKNSDEGVIEKTSDNVSEDDDKKTSGNVDEEDDCTINRPTVAGGNADYKPVIYLYPEKETNVSVKLDYAGKLTSTYPSYDDGWNVIAKPDGTLYSDENDREYYCLFWEGVSDVEYDFSKGFVVPGDETEKFLEEKLALLGLTEKEANEFIIFWLPQMEGNAYNLISFQGNVYTDNARLNVTPAPDTMIRVFMAWQELEEPIDIEPQELKNVERIGFTVVEWGGSEVVVEKSRGVSLKEIQLRK